MKARSPIYPEQDDQQRSRIDECARLIGSLPHWPDRLDLVRIMLGTDGMTFGEMPCDPDRFAGWRMMVSAALERVPTAGRIRHIAQAVMYSLTVHDDWRQQARAYIDDPAHDAGFMVFAARNRWLEPMLKASGDVSSAGYPAAHRFPETVATVQ
jgi:hypothetical protein